MSAGRVQSVALRMVCEREEEIEAFVPQEYWTIHTLMDKEGKQFEAELSKIKGKAVEKTSSLFSVIPELVEKKKASITSLLYVKYSPSVSYKLVNGNVGIVENRKTIPHYMILFI